MPTITFLGLLLWATGTSADTTQPDTMNWSDYLNWLVVGLNVIILPILRSIYSGVLEKIREMGNRVEESATALRREDEHRFELLTQKIDGYITSTNRETAEIIRRVEKLETRVHQTELVAEQRRSVYVTREELANAVKELAASQTRLTETVDSGFRDLQKKMLERASLVDDRLLNIRTKCHDTHAQEKT